jgi:transposase
MLGDISKAERIFIACGYTDLRRGIDGLAAQIKQSFNLDPYANSLFLFCGRRSDRIKALYYEGDGFLLLYKRLETGRYQWPRNTAEVKELTWQQVRWLTEGLSIMQPKAIKNILPNDVV